MPQNRKKKLAILGGGIGSLVTAWHLTSQPNWREIYESITIYQTGWRLGGKCASGRDPNGRIEEHGLHIWFGFYDNSFDVIQNAYAMLERPAGSPLATWSDAFKKHSYLVFAQQFKGQWYPWGFDFPMDDRVPGRGAATPNLWQYIRATIDFIINHFERSKINLRIERKVDSDEQRSALSRLRRTVGGKLDDLKFAGKTLAAKILALLASLVHNLGDDITRRSADDLSPIATLLGELHDWIRRELGDKINVDLEVHRFVVLMDLAITTVKGLLAERVLFHPDKLGALDHLDLLEWLSQQGALKETVNSDLLRGLYDLVFGFRNGEIGRPSFAAGTAIRCMFRICLAYKGGIFWKMQAGMGDAVIAPLYLALKKRGVTFEFFRRVKNLSLSSDKRSIETISIGRQATVKSGEYDPLVTIKDLECWPSTPNYDQLVEGEEIQNLNVNLESFYTTWNDVETLTLRAGEHFDDVVFGISLASIPYLCEELLSCNGKWRAMVDNVETTRTMAFQAWMNKDLKELGWDHGESPIMDAYVEPMDTWADMSELIGREAYPPSSNIRSISYFCGPMEGGIPPQSETDTPKRALEIVKQISDKWLSIDSKTWWPKNVDPATGKFDWNSVVDTYHRANIDPSERYVLSVSGSTTSRLTGYESGFSNLYLAGDWTVNGLNAGCVEAATISGKVVGNVLAGNPPLKDVWGYKDL
jgi:uncharacterized protein with NAD-binding domain and iron-sulfur cluster